MTILQNSPEQTPSPKSLSSPEPLTRKLPSLLSTVGLEIARLKRSVEPITQAEISINHKGNGHYLITPNSKGRETINAIGFNTFSKAVELAMISQDWGIVETVSPETNSIEIFVPSSASQRQ